MAVLGFLGSYLSRYRAKTALGMAAKGVEVVFELLTPLVVARMIDVGVGQRDAGEIVRLGFVLVLFTAVGYGFTLICQYLASKVSQAVGTDMRDDLFSKVLSLGALDIERFGASSLITRVTGDINQVQLAVAMFIRVLLRWPLLAIGSMIAAIAIDLRLGLVFFVAVPAIALVFFAVMSKSVKLFARIQESLERIALATREALSGVRVLRAFRREDYERTRMSEAAKEQMGDMVAVGWLSAALNPATLLIVNLGIVYILWTGAVRIGGDAGGLTQGQLVAFVNYMTQMLLAVTYIASFVVVFTRGFASARRIEEVLSTEPSIDRRAGARLAEDAEAPALELDHVSFTFDDAAAPAVEDVTLSLGRGDMLGIIGGTGSGKSTLSSLVARLIDPTSGTVRLFGHDLREYPDSQLRGLVSVVPQHPLLVSGTVRSNLSWRKADAGDEELLHALDLAQAGEFVRERPLGLSEPVDAGGTNYSGGQRQRLSIARALVGEPRLLILDDSASALDYATEARLRHALSALGDTSVICISQRVASVRHADLIAVLDHGRLAALGTHDELLGSCALYREICLSQHVGEEVS